MKNEAGRTPGAALLSCDVFDTALVRRAGSPSAVFLILGRRLALRGLIRSTPEVFARARIEANRRARANAGRGMALADIYLELQFALGLDDEEREAIRREELELEAELLVPVPGAAARLDEARASGMTVTFLSDMYLGSAFLQEQLDRHGMIAEGERCHVSCEAGCGKEDGRGFRLMAEREAVELGRIVHRGNDPRADIAAARALGIATEPFLQGNLQRYETVLDSHSFATGGLSSVIAGASRLARLSVPASDPREEALRDVAASVAAPVLISYALWVLLRAHALGVRRLVFPPPTTSILLQVAEQLNRRLKVKIDLSSLPYGDPESPDQVLATEGATEPTRFVLARAGEGSPTAPERVHAYFADHSPPRGYHGRVDELFLLLFSTRDADGGTGARQAGSGLPAGIGRSGGHSSDRPGLSLVPRTVLAVAEHLWLDAATPDLEVDLRPAMADVIETFLGSPSPAEARAWSSKLARRGPGGGSLPPARPLTLRHLPQVLGSGRLDGGAGASWPGASLALTPPVTRGLLTTALRLRSRLGGIAGKLGLPRGRT